METLETGSVGLIMAGDLDTGLDHCQDNCSMHEICLATTSPCCSLGIAIYKQKVVEGRLTFLPVGRFSSYFELSYRILI